MALTDDLAELKALLELAETPLEYCLASILGRIISDEEGAYNEGSLISSAVAAGRLDRIIVEYKRWNKEHS